MRMKNLQKYYDLSAIRKPTIIKILVLNFDSAFNGEQKERRSKKCLELNARITNPLGVI
jgi:hypothetical protein